MLLYLKYAIQATGDNDLLFFQTAYYWRFKKHFNCINDTHTFRRDNHIPSYVEEYVRHLQSTTGEKK